MRPPAPNILRSTVLKLLGFQGIGKLIGIHLVADYSRLRFTFRCDLARVINLIYIGLHMVSQIYSGSPPPPPPPSPLPLFETLTDIRAIGISHSGYPVISRELRNTENPLGYPIIFVIF